jgi:mannitol-specific phosphotransferase system IIBC component
LGRVLQFLPPPGTSLVLGFWNTCVYTGATKKERLTMKKLLTLMFALALSMSMSSFAFSQDKADDKKMDKKEEKKKDTKKKDKKKKDDTMKKDDAK